MPDRRRRVMAPIGAALGAGAATAVLAVRSPHETGSWGLCLMHALTGIPCPFCGGLRSVFHLLHGQWLTALHYNSFVVLVTLPLAVVLWALWLRSRWQGHELRVPTRPLLWFLAAAVVFGVVRLLPVAAFFNPDSPWG